MDREIIKKLFEEAKDMASKNFCCKHSRFTVGAVLLTKDGQIIKGFNIENDGIQSICAERVAFSKALSEGIKDFVAIAIVGKELDGDSFEKTLPCGYCRQFMREYAKEDFLIYTYDEKEDKLYEHTIKELLPESFDYRE